MQSITPASNPVFTFPSTNLAQRSKLKSSAVSCMPTTTIQIPHLSSFSHCRSNGRFCNTTLNAVSPTYADSIPRTTKLEPTAIESPRAKRYFEVELQVRDYELDQYDVVNNAVYAKYCQHGHNEFLKSLGIDNKADGGVKMALNNIRLKFFGPLRSADKFVIKVRASSLSESRIFLEHFICRLPDNELILEAKATAVWVDMNHQPVALPSEIETKILELYFSDNYS